MRKDQSGLLGGKNINDELIVHDENTMFQSVSFPAKSEYRIWITVNGFLSLSLLVINKHSSFQQTSLSVFLYHGSKHCTRSLF